MNQAKAFLAGKVERLLARRHSDAAGEGEGEEWEEKGAASRAAARGRKAICELSYSPVRCRSDKVHTERTGYSLLEAVGPYSTDFAAKVGLLEAAFAEAIYTTVESDDLAETERSLLNALKLDLLSTMDKYVDIVERGIDETM